MQHNLSMALLLQLDITETTRPFNGFVMTTSHGVVALWPSSFSRFCWAYAEQNAALSCGNITVG